MGDPQSPEMQPVSGDTLSKDGYGIASLIIRFALCTVIFSKKYVFVSVLFLAQSS